MSLLAGVGALWAIRGDHARIIALREALIQAVAGWFPPPELVETARAALAVAITNSMILIDDRGEPLQDLLGRLPVGEGTDPRLAAMVKVTLMGRHSNGAVLRELCRSENRDEALVATQMSAHVLENAGNVAEAIEMAERGLTLLPENEGPWLWAILHSTLAHLNMQRGDRQRAVAHARAALPVLSRIGATDDETQLRSLLLIIALGEGDLRAAEAELAEIDRINDGGAVLGGLAVASLCAAELALARGDTAAALAEYRLAVERARALRLPEMPNSGFEPWVVMAEALALTTHAYHAEPADLPYGEELFRFAVSGRAPDLLSADRRLLDYPVSGSLLFGLGVWGLLRAALPLEDAVALLVLAERFAYNAMMGEMTFDRIEPYAEQKAPGAIARARAGYGDRRGADLLDEARALIGRLAAGHMCRL